MAKRSGSLLGRILRHAVLLANIAAVLWLVACHASSVTHPVRLKYISLFSLTLPFALVTNMVFVGIWLFSSRKYLSLISLAVLVYCWKMIPAVFGIHYFSKQDWGERDSTFKLMSWNVHAMGTFNTPHEKRYANGVLELIRAEDPDVLCLPEFAVNSASPKKSYTDKIKKAGRYTSYHFNIDNGFGRDILIGTAIFSRYPVVRYKPVQLSPFIFLIECDLRIAGRIVRVGVVHLKSFGLSDQDKAVIEEVKADQNTESLVRSRSFLWKFNQAYVQRADEADKVREAVRRSPYPVIICGDFNDLPYSYTYTTIRGKLKDAFSEKGRGFGRTYNQIIPTLRIDHVLYSPSDLSVAGFKTPYSAFSDHSPVITNFEIISKAGE